MMNVAERLFQHHRLAVMGIVNVTPDSFSDGGRFYDAGRAIDHALAMAEAGADIVDVGGESTRPGSQGISIEAELERVMPVVRGVRRARPELLLSVDTSKVEVARAALDLGVEVVNDVTAGAEEGMLELAGERGATVVLMHMRGAPRVMQRDTQYDDVVGEVLAYLLGRAEAARGAGVTDDAIVIDPGVGFGKSVDGNLELLRNLDRFTASGYPVMVGTSRKSFLGMLTGAPVEGRVGATLASLIPALGLDRVIARVHDVEEVVRFRTVAEAIAARGPIRPRP